MLKELGFTNVYVVPEQELPDGDFPTVSYPNPEADEAFTLGLKLAKEIDADLVLATDPDADRLGVHVKDTGPAITILSPEICPAAFSSEYELSQRKGGSRQAFRRTAHVVKHDRYHKHGRTPSRKPTAFELIEVLTGFKYIGQQILEH